jgi:hypothetical protein
VAIIPSPLLTVYSATKVSSHVGGCRVWEPNYITGGRKGCLFIYFYGAAVSL